MNTSLKLLNNYIKVDDQDPLELAERITRIGHEVEGHHHLAIGSKLVVGYVKECIDHPNSDHLHICQVEVAQGETTQIVCGAPNVAAGEKVIVALPGCQLHGGKIAAGKIRGEESNGMICSIAELIEDQRLLSDADKDGIHVLPDDAPVGHEALSYMGLDDFILEISLTPNRSDCMAMTSLAYEVGAILHRPVKLPEVKKYDELESDITVDVETDLCPFFGAKLVKGVETHESPEWLRKYLIASGIKAINNVVDISNFVMVETGQPLHMYDYDKLKAKKFTIKQGFKGSYQMLDGENYDILPEDIIVSTDDGVGCVAGVMGAESTKVDENTRNIVIEAATFDGAQLRQTARRLNLLTEASQHYIKGALNTANTLNVLDRTADLLKQLADAKEIYKTVATPYTYVPKVVEVSVERVNSYLGTSLTEKEIADIFDSLCFNFDLNNGQFAVTVPAYRNDITMDADLIEEVARIYGYDNIPATLPEMSMTIGVLTEKQKKERDISHLLADAGLHETLTYTLTSPEHVNDFNLFMDQDQEIKLMSPLGEERSVARKSVLPHLLEVIKYNNDHAINDVNIFEIANTYSSKDDEVEQLGIAMTGHYVNVPWLSHVFKANYYVIKGLVEKIMNLLNINEARYKLVRVEEDNRDFHPGRSAYIMMGKDIVGVIGQVHPAQAKNYGIGETYVAQLNLTALFAVRSSKLKFTPLPLYPSVNRDLALIVDRHVPASDIERTLFRASKLIKETKVFDVYEGEHVDSDKKSIAISLVLQDDNKTLDEKEVTQAMEQALAAVKKAYNAELRQ